MAVPAGALEHAMVKVTVTRGGETLLDQLIHVQEAPGRMPDLAIAPLPYLVCSNELNGQRISAVAHTVRDGAAVMAVVSPAGVTTLDVVVETADEAVRAKSQTCLPAPVSSTVQRKQFDLPYGGKDITVKLPGGITIVARPV